MCSDFSLKRYSTGVRQLKCQMLQYHMLDMGTGRGEQGVELGRQVVGPRQTWPQFDASAMAIAMTMAVTGTSRRRKPDQFTTYYGGRKLHVSPALG